MSKKCLPHTVRGGGIISFVCRMARGFPCLVLHSSQFLESMLQRIGGLSGAGFQQLGEEGGETSAANQVSLLASAEVPSVHARAFYNSALS